MNPLDKEKSPQVAVTTSEEKAQVKILFDGKCVDECIFPIISMFENGAYINNGHTEILQTENQIIVRPYQR